MTRFMQTILTNRFRQTRAVMGAALLLAGCMSMTGCSTISGIPVNRVPAEILATDQKDDYQDISMLRLRQDPPEFYALGPGDVLGVYIKGVLGDENQLPPVHYPEDTSLPPAVGYPTPIREDGTVSLPIVKPINIEGLSIVEASNRIREAYTGGPAPILPKDSEVSLTMIRKRHIRVLVIRQENGGVADISKRGTGHIVDLPAYENDLLNALNRTGGLPGLDAENQVLIYRGMYQDGVNYDNLVSAAGPQDGATCDDCFCDESKLPDPAHVTRVPLRYHPSQPPSFREDDIVLGQNDIVIIRSRDNETFYTAGLLGGGEHYLPRDKDLDVLGAVAMAGGPIGQTSTGVMAISGGGGGGRGGGFGGGGNGGGQNGQFCQPSEVLVIRELPCGDQITIKVDLERALEDPSQRILIKPNDVVMLKYKLSEEVSNVFLSLIQFNFLLNGFNGSSF